MRLSRLDLTRFGKFTDRVLDFGERPTEGPDLTLVVGPNEAGKSTAFEAYLSLLFGIPRRNGFGFLHAQPSLEVGGRLDLDGRSLDLVRVKLNQDDLRTRAGDILAPGALGSALGGLTREAYRAMFSLDDKSLAEGGEAIEKSKGELGAMLFAATSGLSEIAARLEAAREEAAALFRPGARAQSTAVAEAKARLKALKDEQDKIDVLAHRFEAMRKAREDARAAHEAATAAETTAAARLSAIDRRLAAMPLERRREAAEAALAPLAHLAAPPAGWIARADDMALGETRLAEQARQRAEALAALEAEHEALAPDERMLALAPRVEALADLRARHRTARLDLPRREAERRAGAEDVRRALAALGQGDASDPASLVPPAATLARIGELADAHGPLAAALETATRELDALGLVDPAPAATIAPAAARRWVGALAEAEARARLATARAEETALAAKRAAASAEALARGEGLVDDAALAALSRAREDAWAAHEGGLDGPDRRASAARYAAAAAAERAALAGNLARASRLGEWRAEARKAEDARLLAAETETARQGALATLAGLRAEIDAALAAHGLPAGGHPEDLAGHLDKAERARSLVLARERARAALEDWREAWRRALAGTVLAMDEPPSVAAARAMLAGLATLREAAGRLAGFDRQVAAMREDAAAFAKDLATLAAEAGVAFDPADPASAAAAIDGRLADARRLAAARDAKAAEIDKARARLAESREAMATLAAERDTMLARYGAADLDALRRALADAARAEALRGDLAAIAADLAPLTLPGDAPAGALDADALAAARGPLGAEVEAARAEARAAHAALVEAERAIAAIGDDAAPARLAERRRATLLEIEALAETYLRLRLGVVAVEAAVRAYRDRHRGAMLEDAARRFRTITGGSFGDLRTAPAEKGETLLAVRPQGGSQASETMSKGTRDQLFLALRMAGYMEWLRTRLPLPFVADDVMETFDDQRAEASFAMLAEVARHGQVIYLTHHEHLEAIARRAVGGELRVLRL